MIDWQDLIPLPGSFVNNGEPEKDFDTPTYGVVHALNWAHAEYRGLRLACERAGDEWGRCYRCGAHIRYAVVFKDGAEHIHMVGEDCADFVRSGLSLDLFAEKRLTKEVQKRSTKHGERFVLSFEAPQWFWNIAKASRPSFCSLSKFRPRNSDYDKWYVTVWGTSEAETVANYLQLLALRRSNAAA